MITFKYILTLKNIRTKVIQSWHGEQEAINKIDLINILTSEIAEMTNSIYEAVSFKADPV